ncbi:hypothetical protein HQ533_02045 [Candidatus Woesearchaeota archaeon]|nr:hypothetical protein [Candidatus Woesearchaeota archaeon]
MKRVNTETKAINLVLSDKTHDLAKICAVLKKTTLKEYIKKAIEVAIEEDKKLLKEL